MTEGGIGDKVWVADVYRGIIHAGKLENYRNPNFYVLLDEETRPDPTCEKIAYIFPHELVFDTREEAVVALVMDL